ncbi:MAG: ABC transporter ATP-binding protein, partial [Faecalibacterium sp.]|nr:ABC transporter ATP-binding protein [Faecalibacterium sp.]
QELMAGGTTVILVSHSIEQIERMCTKVAWLSHGHLKMNGDTQTVCAAYKATQRGEV